MKKEKILNNVLFIFVILLILFVITKGNTEGDFNIYWGAFKAFYNHENPYSPESISRFLHLENPTHLTIWNPPIIFFYLSWIFIFSEDLSFILINVFSVTTIFLTLYFISKIENIKISNLSRILAYILLFSPILLTLYVGQISLVLTLFMVLSYYLIEYKNKDIVGGLFLPILLIKAHIFGLYLCYIFVIMVLKRRYKILLGGLISLVFSLLFVQLINPSSFYYFINNFHGVYVWRANALIDFFPSLNIFRYHIYAIICLSFTFISIIQKKIMNFYIFCCVSVLLIPYGYIFDYTILLPTVNYLVLNKDYIKKDILLFSCFIILFILNMLIMINNTKSLLIVVFILLLLFMLIKVICYRVKDN